jgi:hypothetical protein
MSSAFPPSPLPGLSQRLLLVVAGTFRQAIGANNRHSQWPDSTLRITRPAERCKVMHFRERSVRELGTQVAFMANDVGGLVVSDGDRGA